MKPPKGAWLAAALMLAVVLLADSCLAQRAVGDNATTAYPINGLPFVSSIIRTDGGDDGAFTDAFRGSSCLESRLQTPAADAWFSFRPTTSARVQFDIFSPELSELAVSTGLADRMQLHVLDSTLSSVACEPVRGLLTSATPLALVSVTANAVYYVVVEWAASLDLPLTFMLSAQLPQQGTTSDNPIVVPTTRLPYTISTSNAPLTDANLTQPTCWELTPTAPVKYFSYTPTATGDVYLHLCDSAAKSIDAYTSYIVVSTTPGPVRLPLACAAHGCDSTASFSGLPMVALSLNRSSTYYIAVYSRTPYTLTIQGPLQGDSDANPLRVPSSGLPYTFSSSFGAIGIADSERVAGECSVAAQTSADGKDVVFSYVATVNQRLIIDVLSNAGFFAPTELLQAYEIKPGSNDTRSFLSCILGGAQEQAQGLSAPALQVPVTAGSTYVFVYDWAGLSVGGDYVVTIRDAAVGTSGTPVLVDDIPFEYASSGRLSLQLSEFYRESDCGLADNDTVVFELGELSPPWCPPGALCSTALDVSTCEIPGTSQGLTMVVTKSLSYHVKDGEGTPQQCTDGCFDLNGESSTSRFGGLLLPFDQGLRVIVHSDGPFKFNADATLPGDDPADPIRVISLPMSDRRDTKGYSYSQRRLGETGCGDRTRELWPDVFYTFSHSSASRVAVDFYTAGGPLTPFTEIINDDDLNLNSECNVTVNGNARVYTLADGVPFPQTEGLGSQHTMLVKWPPLLADAFIYTLTIKDADLGNTLATAINLTSLTTTIAENGNLVHAYNSSTTGMANSIRPPSSCVASTIDHRAPDMIFRLYFPCPAAGPCDATRVLVSVCGDGDFPLISTGARVSVYLLNATGAPFTTAGACSAGSCTAFGDGPQLNVTLPGGVDFFLVVDGVASDSFPFALRIEHPALPGDSLSSPLVIPSPLPFTFVGNPENEWFWDSGSLSDECQEAPLLDYNKDIAFSYTAATAHRLIVDAYTHSFGDNDVLQVFRERPPAAAGRPPTYEFLNCSSGVTTNGLPFLSFPVTAGSKYSFTYDWLTFSFSGDYVVTIRDASVGTSANPVNIASLPFEYRSSTRGAPDITDAYASSCGGVVLEGGLRPFVFKLGKPQVPAGTTPCPHNAQCDYDLFLSTCETPSGQVVPTPPVSYIEYSLPSQAATVPTQLFGCTQACTLGGDSKTYNGNYLVHEEGAAVVVYSNGPFVFHAKAYLPGDDSNQPIVVTNAPMSDQRSSQGYTGAGETTGDSCVGARQLLNGSPDVFYSVTLFQSQVLVDLYSPNGPTPLYASVTELVDSGVSTCLYPNGGASRFASVSNGEDSQQIPLSIAVKWAANVTTPFSYTLTVKDVDEGRGLANAVNITQQAGSLAANGNLVQEYASSTPGMGNSSSPPATCGGQAITNHTAPEMFFRLVIPCLEAGACGQARVLVTACGQSTQPLISPSAKVALYTLDASGNHVPGASFCSVGSCARPGVAPPALNISMARGVPFYIVVDGAEGESFPFSLRLEYPGAAGDSIVNPLLVPPSLPFTFVGDTQDVSFHNSEPISATCLADTANEFYDKDVIFSFTSPLTGRIIIDSTGQSQMDQALQAFREVSPSGAAAPTRQLLTCDSGSLAALSVPVTAGSKYVFVYDWAVPSFGGEYTVTIRDASLGTLDKPVLIDVLPFEYKASARMGDNVTERVHSNCGSIASDGFEIFLFKLGPLDLPCPRGASCEPALSLSTCAILESGNVELFGPDTFLEYNAQGEVFVSDDPSDDRRPLRFSNCTLGCRFNDETSRAIGDTLVYRENASIALYAAGNFELHVDALPQGDDREHPITVASLPMSDYRNANEAYSFSTFQLGSFLCGSVPATPRPVDMFYKIDHSITARVAVDLYSADVPSPAITALYGQLLNPQALPSASRCLNVNGRATVFTAADAVREATDEPVVSTQLEAMVQWNPDAVRGEDPRFTFTFTVKDLDVGSNTSTAIDLLNLAASVAEDTGNFVYTYESSTVGMSNAMTPPDPCGAASITDHAAGDMFFRINIPCPTSGACDNSTFVATICDEQGNNRISPFASVVLYMLDSTGVPLVTEGACSLGSCANADVSPPAINITLEREVDYFLVVDGEFSDEFPFKLRVEIPDPDAVPGGLVETTISSPLPPTLVEIANKTMRGYWSRERSTPFSVTFDGIMNETCGSDAIVARQLDTDAPPRVEGFRLVRRTPKSEYAFNITAETDGTVTYFIKGGGCRDIKGRLNNQSEEIRYGVDSTPPTLTIRSEVGERSDYELLLFNVIVDEPVFGLTNESLSVTNGNLTSWIPSPEGNGSTLVVVTPEPGNHFVTLRYDGVIADIAGNINEVNTTARIDYFINNQDVVDAVAAGSAVVATTITTTGIAVMGAALAGSTSLGVGSPSVASFSSGLTIMIGHIQTVQQLNGLGAPLGATFRQLTHEMNWVNFRATPPWRWGDDKDDKNKTSDAARGGTRRRRLLAGQGQDGGVPNGWGGGATLLQPLSDQSVDGSNADIHAASANANVNAATDAIMNPDEKMSAHALALIQMEMISEASAGENSALHPLVEASVESSFDRDGSHRRRRALMGLDDPGDEVDEVLDYKFKMVSSISSSGRENVLGDFVDNKLQDFGADSMEEFAIVIFWFCLLLVAVGGTHLCAQFTWEKLLAKGEMPPLMQFPRFEIFLLMVGLPGVTRACASLIRQRTTGEVLLGIAVLLVYPFTFLCFAGYFVFRKLLSGRHVKFIAESEPAPRGMSSRDIVINFWRMCVTALVGPRRAAEWMVVNPNLAAKKGDWVSKYGLFFEDLAGATHYARPVGGMSAGVDVASVRDVDDGAEGSTDTGVQMLPVRGSPITSGAGITTSSRGSAMTSARDGAVAGSRDGGIVSRREGGAASTHEGPSAVNSPPRVVAFSTRSLNGGGGEGAEGAGTSENGTDVAMVEINLNGGEGKEDADNQVAASNRSVGNRSVGGKGEDDDVEKGGKTDADEEKLVSPNGAGNVSIMATDADMDAPGSGTMAATIGPGHSISHGAQAVDAAAASAGRAGGDGAGTLGAPAGAHSLRPRLDVRYSKGRSAQMHLVRIRGLAVTVAHCRASYMFLTLCKQFLFAIMLGAYKSDNAWSQIIVLTVWLFAHTAWIFAFKPFLDRLLQFVESVSITFELGTLCCSLGLLINDARDGSETTRHRLSTAMIVLAFAGVGVNVINQWYDIILMIKEFGPVVRRKLFERRFQRPQDNAVFDREPGCC